MSETQEPNPPNSVEETEPKPDSGTDKPEDGCGKCCKKLMSLIGLGNVDPKIIHFGVITLAAAVVVAHLVIKHRNHHCF